MRPLKVENQKKVNVVIAQPQQLPAQEALYEQLALHRLRRVHSWQPWKNWLLRKFLVAARLLAHARIEREIGPGRVTAEFREHPRAVEMRVRFL